MVRSCVDGPVFRRRPGPLGRRRHRARRRARRARSRRATDDDPLTRDHAPPRRTRRRRVARRRHDAPRSAALELPDPVLTASGCAAAGRELDQFFDLAGSARSSPSRSCSRRGRAGRPRGWPRPRAACSTRSACRARASTRSSTRTCPGCAEHGARAVVSIAGGSVEEYAELAAAAARASTASSAIEVNISCPNVENRGQVFACDPVAAAEVVARRARATPRPASRCSPSSRPTSPTSSTIARAVRRRRRRRAVDDQHRCSGMVIDTDTHAPGARPASPAGCPARRSGRSRCAASGRCTPRCPTCRSSAWAASAPGSTRSSSSSPARRAVSVGTARLPRPVRAGPRARASCARRSPTRGFDRLADAVGHAHRAAGPRRVPARRRPTPATPTPTEPLDGRSRGMSAATTARPIAVALDAPDLDDRRCAGPSAAGPYVSTVKVGLELFLRDGADAVARGPRGQRRTATCSSTSSCTTSPTPSPVRPASVADARARPTSPSTPRGGAGDGRAPPSTRCPTRGSPRVTVLTSLSADDLDAVGLRGPAARRRAPARRARGRRRCAGARLLAAGGRRRPRRGRRRHHADHPGRAPGRRPTSATRRGSRPRSRRSPTAPTCS